MSRKRNIRVVDKESKKYNRFSVIMCDESIFEFDLKEWNVYREEEWVEVSRIDGAEMNCFSVSNIMRVRFTHTEKKTNMQEVIQLRPVPPNDAA